MDWDHARVFLAIARTGQILGAARKLKLDHATVARRLDKLEESLNARLFERQPSGCLLTPAGERFFEIAERVEGEMLRIQSEIAGADATVAGTVRLAAPDALSTFFLGQCLGRLSNLHPDLTLQMVPLSRTFSLTKREADIAITLERPTEGRLLSAKLVDYRLGLYASRDHLAAHGAIESAADVAGRVIVTYVPDLIYSSALDYAHELEKLSTRRLESASAVTQMALVCSGTGVGILHDYAARTRPELQRILPDMSYQRSYWLVTHADVRHMRRIEAVHDFLKAEIKAQHSIFG